MNITTQQGRGEGGYINRMGGGGRVNITTQWGKGGRVNI